MQICANLPNSALGPTLSVSNLSQIYTKECSRIVEATSAQQQQQQIQLSNWRLG